MKLNTREMTFIKFNGQEMQWVKFNGVIVYEAWRELIKNGVPPLTLEKCKGVDLIDYKLYGNSIQDGEPTPEAPIEVESVGERTKNLCNLGTKTFVQHKLYELDEPLPAGTYTISCFITTDDTDSVNNTCLVGLFDENGSAIQYVFNLQRNMRTSRTFTISQTAYGLGLYASDSWNNGTNDTATFKDIQIEQGSKATEYEGYYKIPVKARGKNLWDKETYPFIIGNYQNNNNQINTYQKYVLTTTWQKLEAGTYTISGNVNKFGIYLVEQTSDTTSITTYLSTGTSTSFTLENDTIISAQFNCSGDTADKFIDLYSSSIQIEKGDIATDYEPYVEPVTTNIYLNEPLRKVDDVADYIDFKNSKVVRNLKHIKITGNESWANQWSGRNTYIYKVKDIYSETSYTEEFKGYCNYYPRITHGKAYSTTNLVNGVTNIVGGAGICIRDINSATLEEFKQKLSDMYNSGTPVMVDYLLATPDDTETIELPNIPTLKGTTVLEVDTTIQPSNMEVVYKGKFENLDTETNDILNSILSSDTKTQKDITDTEIIEILDEIIGG